MLDYNKEHNWYYDLYAQRGRIENPLKEKKKEEIKKPVVKPSVQEANTSYVISSQDFLVVTSVRRCVIKGHELLDVDAKVRVIIHI